MFDERAVVRDRRGIAGIGLEAGSIRDPGAQERGCRLDADLLQDARRLGPREARRPRSGPSSAIEHRPADEEHLVHLGGPEGHVRKHIKEAADQRPGIFVVLRAQRPPLRHQASRLETIAAQLVEITRELQVRHARRGRRRRLEA